MFKWIKKAGKALSPKRKITAIVVAVVDAFREQYELEVRIVEGGFRFSIVDKPAEWDDIDEIAETE